MIKYFYGPVNAGKTEKAINEILKFHTNFAYIKVEKDENIFGELSTLFKNIIIGNAQFLSDEALLLICNWAKENFINVYFVGLVYNKNCERYSSHQTLMCVCDETEELEVKCECGQKAVYNICVNTNDEAMLHTSVVDTRLNYKAVCPLCYKALIAGAECQERLTLAQDAFIECYN